MAGIATTFAASAIAACSSSTTPAPASPASGKPAAGAATAPAAPGATSPAGAKPEAKIGRHLIGKLEGPEIVTDPAKWPKKFAEAPMLAELVKAGKLPPVDQRIPEEPLVLKPVHAVGKYGGIWRRGFTGPADFENGNRICSTDKLLFSDFTGTKTVPSVAKGWKASDDGKSFTITLRKGLKWSDGKPFTADDIMFWFQDMVQNKDLVPIQPPDLAINGKPGKIEKADQYTIVFQFPEPYYLLEEFIRGDGRLGSGFATGGSPQYGSFMGGYAPAHYLKQFHTKYISKEELDTKVKAGGFDNWVSMMKNRSNWSLNTECPVLTPWKTATPINTSTWTLERNPYYWEIDTEGNQLPYIDKIVMQLAENLEVLNLRAAAGEFDMQSRHIDLAKLPVLLENQQKGNYTIRLDPAEYGSDACLMVNLTYEADAEIAKWLNTTDFRRALSLGIERDQLNETFWLGVGTPGSPVVAETSPYSPGPEYRKLWSTLDVKKANEMLDKIGLDKKDSDGYRLRTDGKGRLRIEVQTIGASFTPITQIMEVVREHWKKIGIQVDVTELERSLFLNRINANEHQIAALPWGNTGTEVLLTNPGNALPVFTNSPNGPLYGKWYGSFGATGKKPTDPSLVKAFDLFRSAAGQPLDGRIKVAKEIWKIAIDEQWTIGLVGLGPAVQGVRITKNNMGNVPERLSIVRDARVPGASHTASYFYKS
jgi:peptide/nickel transport system substrate-binding protein